MSQQPYMYSPYTGRQAQQAYPYSSTPGQPPGLTFGAPPATSPGVVAGNFAAANRSFEYNASRIPGLGMGGSTSPSFSASLFRAENKPLWPQGLSEAPAPATPPVPAAPAAAAPTTAPVVDSGQKQLQAPASAPVPGNSSQTPRQSGAGDALEEGELSDDESEDIYEPKHSPAGAVNKATQAFRPASTAVDQQGSAGDADGSSIYDTGSSREEVMIDSASASLPAVEENEEEYSPGGYDDSVAYQPRDRSGSYSPYLSPREVHKEAPGARRSLQDMRTAASQHHVPLPTSVANNDVPAARKVPARAANGHILSAPAPAQRSAAEAKKKAQEAILGLWPLKVRYQDYIDEGLDPVVVKKLFTDLGLDMSSPKTTNTPAKPTVSVGLATPNPAAPSSAPAPAPAASLLASPASAQPQTSNLATSTTANNTGHMTMVDKKSEERKDKIARMLAEKKQKSAPASSLNAAATTSSTTPAPKAPPAPAAESKAKTKAENTLKLQQKLAILRKAQEENEARKRRKQVAVTQPSSALTPHADDQGPSENTPVAADSTPAPSKQVSPSVDSEAASPAPGIPGLNLPAHQLATKGRVAKRPVAADFDAYPPASGYAKRNRTQERLIIDVSDDEDVEMDIGSPVDGPTGGIQTQSSNTPYRPNSLGTFPPLSTTTTWRHKSSPVQTPPEQGNKLDFLHRQIEEAKRKIAEAEAKKKANRPFNETSSPLAQTPGPAETAAGKLPKASDRRKSTPRASSERRERIASVQLPLLESALKEKQEKLKRLQIETSQLELEVQASLAERQKLTLEMSTLDDSNDDDTEESAPLSPHNNPDSTAPITAPPDVASTPPNEEAELTTTAAPPTGFTAQDNPDPEMSDGKSEMDIDSTDSSDSSSSAAEDALVDIDDNKLHAGGPETEAMDTENHSTVNTATSSPGLPRSEIESQLRQSGTGVADGLTITGTENMPSQSETQAVNDADASLQESVAGVSPAGDEPIPAQISRADQIPVSDDEEGEIPDEDPYEPSLAAPAEPVAEHDAQAPTGEVQLRTSGKSLLLTSTQTEQAPLVPAQDLLSYQSPLRYFRAYRFHSKYADSVRGGLRSKTYSSKVRSDVPLCPSSGERDTCPNGPSCQYQHFSDMAATDSDIIASLGSVDSYSRDQRGRFIEGLKKVLSDLKSDPNRIKNFDSITAAILQYRRDFFGGDETKVLPLDGVSI